MIDEERASRMMLLRTCEPGDTRVVDEVARRGAAEVADAILRGSSLLRGAASMRSRLPDGAGNASYQDTTLGDTVIICS